MIIRILLILIAIAGPLKLCSQISCAKIVFERKTNLYKKFKHDENIKEWIKESEKIKVDYFELFFNDTCSLFKPQESELRDNFEWATAKNTVYQFFNSKKRYVVKTMWGEELHLTDSLQKRKWKITESTRKIAGFNCRKAVWQANDSTKIYAWFSYDLITSVGPESFSGLPGTILGVATEDGGVIYFAKKIETIIPAAALFVRPKKKKTYSIPELKAEMTKRYGKEKWFSRMMLNHFGVW